MMLRHEAAVVALVLLIIMMVTAAPLAAALEHPAHSNHKGSGSRSINNVKWTRRSLHAQTQPAACLCTATLKPVCGADGRVYSHDCEAGCSRVQVAGPAPPNVKVGGRCGASLTAASPSPALSCLEQCGPVAQVHVCGADGQVYGDACQALCAGVEVVDFSRPGDSCDPNTASPSPRPAFKPLPVFRPGD